MQTRAGQKVGGVLTPGPRGIDATAPVDLSVGDIRSQIAAEWLQIAQWSQRTA